MKISTRTTAGSAEHGVTLENDTRQELATLKDLARLLNVATTTSRTGHTKIYATMKQIEAYLSQNVINPQKNRSHQLILEMRAQLLAPTIDKPDLPAPPRPKASASQQSPPRTGTTTRSAAGSSVTRSRPSVAKPTAPVTPHSGVQRATHPSKPALHRSPVASTTHSTSQQRGRAGQAATAVDPADLYIGALDAECKPLLTALMATLAEGEGILVVYKRRAGAPTDSVFDGRVQDFTGGLPWAQCTPAADDTTPAGRISADLHRSVDTLAHNLNEQRASTALFSLPGATTVAADTDRFGVGVLSRHGAPVTKIRSVVLEPLNMGLNGDLVAHEVTSTLTAIHSCGALGAAADRPLHHYTWGVGAASSPQTRTGDLLVSDTIVDFRGHYDPVAQIASLKAYVAAARQLNPGKEINDQTFMARCDTITALALAARGKTGPNVYTGTTMVLDLAELAQMACDATGLPMRTGTGAAPPEPGALQSYLLQCTPQWPFYGEVTVRGPNGGQVTLYRSDHSSHSPALGGKAAYDAQMEHLHDVMRGLTEAHHPDVIANLRATQTAQADASSTSHINRLIFHRDVLISRIGQPTRPYEATGDILTLVKSLLEHNERVRAKRNELWSDAALQNPEIRTNLEAQLRVLVSGFDQILVDLDRVAQREPLDQEANRQVALIVQRSAELVQSEREISIHYELKGRLFAGGELMWNTMQTYAQTLPAARNTAGLDVSHTGSKFFKEPDKAIAYVLGGASVEMENQVFALSIDAACVRSGSQARAATPVVTKLAGDPAHIPDHVRAGLNKWAESARMKTEDYVDAMVWVRSGQDISRLPASGKWVEAEAMCNQRGPSGELTPEAKLARSCFSSTGPMTDSADFEILNPFWLDIGTFLAKEASSSSVAPPPAVPGPQSFPSKGEYGTARALLTGQALAEENAACTAVIQAAQAVVRFVGDDEEAYRAVCRVFLTGGATHKHPGFLGLQERVKPVPVADGKVTVPDVHLVHSRQNSMFKTGYVGPSTNIDWDSALYKSSQPVVMTKEGPIFAGWTQALGTKQLSPDVLPYRDYRAAYLAEEHTRSLGIATDAAAPAESPMIARSATVAAFVDWCQEQAHAPHPPQREGSLYDQYQAMQIGASSARATIAGFRDSRDEDDDTPRHSR